MLGKVGFWLSNPISMMYHVWSRLDKNGLFRRYSDLSRKAGLDRLYFVLSFDCDTVEDVGVVWRVHSRLLKMGVMPVYAVPGELLKKGADVYRRIAGTGSEFLNHGYMEHTGFDEMSGTYVSTIFYDQLSPEQVRADIVQGDQALREVLGVRPLGFRTPHFGLFQKGRQLSFLYGVLRDLGYRFSSSTTPVHGFHRGAVFNCGGILEFPVSGMWTYPLSTLDSWSCFRAPGRRLTPNDYHREGLAVARHLSRLRAVGIMNYYADPSHVADNELFYETVAEWARVGRNTTYGSLIQVLEHAKT